jgi:hypothetical protein
VTETDTVTDERAAGLVYRKDKGVGAVLAPGGRSLSGAAPGTKQMAAIAIGSKEPA